MTDEIYSRVEFTADIGFGPIVATFVDFSSQGISFGAPPLNVQIYEGTQEDKSDTLAISVYQRVTIHADGRVETHLATPTPVPELKEFDQYTSPLAQWGNPCSKRFEFPWGPNHIAFLRPWLAKPKPSTHPTCLNIQVEFNPEAVSTVVHIYVLKPRVDVKDVAPAIPCDVQSWFLTGGWPWVLVQMSNVKCPRIDQLSTVGRNYKKADQP